MNNLIKKPVITEKSFQEAVKGKFTFIVSKDADKDSVAKTIENLYNVEVVSANSMNYKGKVKMTKRHKGKRNDFKKVVLTLKPGQKIDLFEIETEEDKKKKSKKEDNKQENKK